VLQLAVHVRRGRLELTAWLASASIYGHWLQVISSDILMVLGVEFKGPKDNRIW
jgi:hypothetical protein